MKKWSQIFVEALILAVIAGMLALAANMLTPGDKKLSWQSGPQVDDKKFFASAEDRKNSAALAQLRTALHSIAPAKDPTLLYLEIQGDVARRLHEAGALFLDARREESYVQAHIANAINIPVWDNKVDDDVLSLQAKGISFDDVIVVYCSGADCSDSLALSEKLAMSGYLNLYVYKNGFPEWKANAWPVTSGKAP